MSVGEMSVGSDGERFAAAVEGDARAGEGFGAELAVVRALVAHRSALAPDPRARARVRARLLGVPARAHCVA